jgi:hypothetical protein
MMWSELRKKELTAHKSSMEKLAFSIFFEEKVWFLSATIDNGFLDKLDELVTKEIHIRVK